MKNQLIMLLVLIMLLFCSCGPSTYEEIEPSIHEETETSTIGPVEDEVEDTDTNSKPMSDENRSDGTQSKPTSNATSVPTVTPGSTASKATDKSEAMNKDNAANQDFSGSLMGEPDTDF